MSDASQMRARIESARRVAFAVGGLSLAVSALAYHQDRAHFMQGWLIAFLFWIAIPLGSLALMMLHNLTGGGWGLAIQRWLQAATRTLPFFVLLFVPIALGMHELYEWSHTEVVAADPLLTHKASYLNPAGFVGRAALYFAIWIGLAIAFNRWNTRIDCGDPKDLSARVRYLSGPGLILYAVAMTFAAIDWAMSLEPHWFSTIYGLIFIIGQVLATLAFTILIAAWGARSAPLSTRLLPTHVHDLGKLMFAFVLLWAYVNYSQYLIIWSANLAEETPWFLRRTRGPWLPLAIGLIVLHFVLPFLVLLSKSVKRNPRLLAIIASLLLVMRLIDLYWLILPAFAHGDAHAGSLFHWVHLAAPIGVGGLWVGLFLGQLKDRPLTSLPEVELHGAVAHH